MEAGQPPAKHRSGINSSALPRTPWVSAFLLGCTCLRLVPVCSGPFVAVTAGNNSCLPVTVFPIKTPWGTVPVPLFQQKLLNYFLLKPEQLCLPFPPCWMQHSHLQTLWAGPWKKWIPLMDWTPLRTAAVKGEELPHNEQGFGKPHGCSL